MIHTAEFNCRWCKHYLQDETCLAFPNGIPHAVWIGKNHHYEAIGGDNGYRFERIRVDLTVDD
jgi:hypothetical protein